MKWLEHYKLVTYKNLKLRNEREIFFNWIERIGASSFDTEHFNLYYNMSACTNYQFDNFEAVVENMASTILLASAELQQCSLYCVIILGVLR